jgi:hypothetical protein
LLGLSRRQGVFLLYDVLTPDECQQYIDLTEKMGYEEATVTTFGGMVKMPDLRNNERVMWQSEEDVWGPIWQRIEPHIPKDVGSARWTPYGLNERLRFYRCTPSPKSVSTRSLGGRLSSCG